MKFVKVSGCRDADDSISPSIKQRTRPAVITLDAELRPVHYENRAMTLLVDTFGDCTSDRLPAPIEESLRQILAQLRSDQDTLLLSVSSLLINVSKLMGEEQTRYVLLLERESRRTPVRAAAERFSLTPREREVLLHVLRGYQASDIAGQLAISQATLSGYFKSLLRKTQTRTRSEMIARVLEWEDHATRA